MFGISRVATLTQGLTVAPTALTYITFNSNVQSGTSGVTAAVTASVGDLIIFFSNAANSGSATTAPPTLVTPAGFTIAKDFPSPTQLASIRYVVGYQVATTSGSRTITSTGGAAGSSHVVLVYRPNASISSVSFTTGTSQVTTATPTNQTFNMTGLMTPLTVGFAGFGSTGGLATGSAGSSTSASTRTVSATFTATYNRVITFEGSGFNATSTTISMSDGGTNTMYSTVMTVA